MTMGELIGIRRSFSIAAVLLLTVSLVGVRATRASNRFAIPQAPSDEQIAQQKERDAEKEEQAREREDERREREQEKKDREQERLDRMEELYDNGREALDEDRFDRAAGRFDELARMNGPQTDAALYWKAYAENRQGKRDSALATLADMIQRFPNSRWQKDAKALQLEVKQNVGQTAKPEAQSDEDLKMLALQGLMNSNPEQAVPAIEKALNGPSSPKVKAKALFILAQSGSPQGRQIIANIAKGQSNPELQRKAVEYLGIFGGPESHKALADVYASTSDPSVKRAILRSYMIGGDKEHLFAAAKSEKDEGLREEAIRQLGLVHGINELNQLYKSESSPEVRRGILQAFFLAGDSGKLVEAARTEKDPELRRAAIRNMGLIHSEESSKELQTIYAQDQDRSVRKEVLNALFLQGDGAAIVAIARNEKDPELKKEAVQKLSIMHSKEGMDYLMEILQK
jgi:HEAT repeat protein